MTPRDFTYWLHGFFELTDATELSREQVQVIKEHLYLVFEKKTPTSIGDSLMNTQFCGGVNCGEVRIIENPSWVNEDNDDNPGFDYPISC